MKRKFIPFIALFAIAIALVSWKNHNAAKDPAVVIHDGLCTLYDGDGNIVVGEFSSVITSSGNNNVKCTANVGNSTGKAVVYKDFLCLTPLGLTNTSHETVSASGQAMLTCKY